MALARGCRARRPRGGGSRRCPPDRRRRTPWACPPGAMPMPVSATRMRTSPRSSRVSATRTSPLAGVNLMAFDSTLRNTCRSLRSSPKNRMVWSTPSRPSVTPATSARGASWRMQEVSSCVRSSSLSISRSLPLSDFEYSRMSRDQVEQMDAALVDVLRVFAIALLAQRAQQLALQHFGEADDGVERRAQLMAHRGQELGLGAARQLGPLHRLMQLALDAAVAQQEAGAVVEQRPVDRLGDEIGGAGLVGAVDRLGIVQPGDHQHGHMGAIGALARLHAGGEAVDPRHHRVQEDQLRLQLVDEVERLQAVAALVDGEPGRLQRLAHQQTMDEIVIGDDNHRRIRRSQTVVYRGDLCALPT